MLIWRRCSSVHSRRSATGLAGLSRSDVLNFVLLSTLDFLIVQEGQGTSKNSRTLTQRRVLPSTLEP
jgi:hypothetical protein